MLGRFKRFVKLAVSLFFFLFLFITVEGVEVKDRPEDRVALTAFYESAHGDTDWNPRYRWPVNDTSISHCKWKGVGCKVVDVGGGLKQNAVLEVILFQEVPMKNARPFKVPKAFSGLTYLQRLNIDYLPIYEVEEGVFEPLSNLTCLYIYGNPTLRALPQLPQSIQEVVVTNTRIQSLSFLEGCSKLRALEVTNSNLTSPLSVSMTSFPLLQDLVLYGNRLTEFPVGPNNSSALHIISVSLNQITTIPDDLCTLSKLLAISVSYNPISSLPECLGNLSSLVDLGIDGTPLTSLPPSISKTSIKHLYMKNCSLESLPASLQSSQSLLSITLLDMPNLLTIDPLIFNAPHFSTFSVVGGSFNKIPSFLYVQNLNFQSFTIQGANVSEWNLSEQEYLPPFAYFELSYMPLRRITFQSKARIRDSRYGSTVKLNNNKLESLNYNFLTSLGPINLLDVSGNPLRDVESDVIFRAAKVDISNTLLKSIFIESTAVIATNISTLEELDVVDGKSDLTEPLIDLRDSNTRNLTLDLDPRRSVSFPETSIVCIGRQYVPTYPISIYPYQLDYQHCSCLVEVENMFDADENPPKCVSKKDLLPQGMAVDYDGGLRNHEFSISPGYYPVSIDALELCDLSQYNSYKMCRIMKCPLREVCNPKGGSEYECANGFDRESLMCSQCPSGSYKALGRCQKCPAAPGVVIGANVLCMMVVVVLYLLWAHRRDAIQVRAYSSLSIFLSWVQITFVLTEFGTRYSSAGSTRGGHMSHAWSTISQLFVGISPLTLPCVDDHWFETSAWLTFFGPLAVCGVLSFVHLFWLAVARPGRSDVQQGQSLLLYMCASVLQFSYVSIVRTTFTLLNCESLGSAGSFVSSAPFVSCSSSGYLRMRRMAYVSICVFVIGIPCLMLYLVSKGRKKCDDDGASRATSRSLLLEYGCESKPGSDEDGHTADAVRTREKNSVIYATMMLLSGAHSASKAYWSVGVVTARKCLILLVLGLLPQDSAAIPVLVVLVLMIAFVLQAYVRPYHYTFDNVLESASLSMSSLNFFSHLVADVRGVESGKVALSDGVFLANTVSALLFVVCVPLWRWRQARPSK